MAVETEIHVVFPYNFKSDTHPLLFASRTIAILDVRALGSNEYTRAFEECFSQDTDFVLNYREYDENIDGDSYQEIIEDKMGRRLRYAPDPEELYKRTKELCENTDVSNYLDNLNTFIKSFKDNKTIRFVLYQY
jgi:hypothetical protein